MHDVDTGDVLLSEGNRLLGYLSREHDNYLRCGTIRRHKSIDASYIEKAHDHHYYDVILVSMAARPLLNLKEYDCNVYDEDWRICRDDLGKAGFCRRIENECKRWRWTKTTFDSLTKKLEPASGILIFYQVQEKPEKNLPQYSLFVEKAVSTDEKDFYCWTYDDDKSKFVSYQKTFVYFTLPAT